MYSVQVTASYPGWSCETNAKSKVFYKDNSKIKYTKITIEEGVFYGYYSKDWYKKSIKFPIDKEQVAYVKTNNKTASVIASSGVALTGVAIALIVIPVIGLIVWLLGV